MKENLDTSFPFFTIYGIHVLNWRNLSCRVRTNPGKMVPLVMEVPETRLIGRDECLYPENLRSIPQPPEKLYVRGQVLPADRVAVALVGTRKATPVGRHIAFELARDLAGAGVAIVSGLAGGIDTKAHEGALDAGGRTLACLACGLDMVYPPSNRELFLRILSSGALLSEYPNGTAPLPWRFPARNRIISGLALGVVVVEAPEKSGALITADWAIKHGRPVMAIPGSVKSAASKGTNRLIQEGAYLVTCAEDVLSFLSREDEYVPDLPERSSPLCVTLEESVIMQSMCNEALTAGEIAERLSSFPAGKVMAVLASLEVKGLVVRLGGGRYVAGKNSF